MYYSVDLWGGSVDEWIGWDGWIASDECLLWECPDLTVVEREVVVSRKEKEEKEGNPLY